MSRDWTREEFGITDNTPVVDIDSLEKKCERLQKQLDIAKEALDYYSDVRKYNKSGWCSTDVGYQKAWEANLKIKDLNEIHKQE